jgi:hypothetical protein
MVTGTGGRWARFWLGALHAAAASASSKVALRAMERLGRRGTIIM